MSVEKQTEQRVMEAAATRGYVLSRGNSVQLEFEHSVTGVKTTIAHPSFLNQAKVVYAIERAFGS